MVNLRGEVLRRGCYLEEKRRLDNLIPMPLRSMTDAEILAWRLRETIEYYARLAEGAARGPLVTGIMHASVCELTSTRVPEICTRQGVRSGKPLQNRAQSKRRSQSKIEFPGQAPRVTKKMAP